MSCLVKQDTKILVIFRQFSDIPQSNQLNSHNFAFLSSHTLGYFYVSHLIRSKYIACKYSIDKDFGIKLKYHQNFYPFFYILSLQDDDMRSLVLYLNSKYQPLRNILVNVFLPL